MNEAIQTSRPVRRNRFVSFLRNMALLFITCVVGLLLFEVALRVFHISAKALPYNNNLGDSVLGMAPEASRVWKADFPEYGGELIMRTNNMGFYEDRDTAPLPKPGVWRVAALGDSLTVGVCTPQENFPNRVEQKLNKLAGAERYEVLDAGVGRYSPYQYFLKAQHVMLPLRPERLLVAIYAGNDFLDIIRQDDRPYLTRSADGRIEAHAPRFTVYDDPASKPNWIESSRTYGMIRATIGPTLLYQVSRVKLLLMNLQTAHKGPLEIARYMAAVKRLDGIAHGMMLQSLHQYVWFKRFPETLPTALIFNRYVIREMRDMCRRNGIQLTYTVIPTKPATEPDTIANVFTQLHAYDPDITPEHLAAFENKLIDDTFAACRELGVEAIDLRSGMARERAGRQLYYPQDMHLNVTGNDVVSDLIVAQWPHEAVR